MIGHLSGRVIRDSPNFLLRTAATQQYPTQRPFRLLHCPLVGLTSPTVVTSAPLVDTDRGLTQCPPSRVGKDQLATRI
jgi:hypothetical protein